MIITSLHDYVNQHVWCGGHSSCLASCTGGLGSNLGLTFAQVLKIIAEKALPLHCVSKWSSFRVFSDKDGKTVGTSYPL